MNKIIQKIFLIITLIFGSLLLVSIRDVLAAPPIVSGVVNNTYYNVPVTITFDEVGGTVTATLNTVSITSGHIVIEDGSYVLFVTDGVESTTINFWIDTVVPQVTGVTNGSTVNTTVTPLITDTSPYNAMLNGVAYTSGTPIASENTYSLIVTDEAGNVTTVNFTIDKTPPVVTGVVDGEYYMTSVSAVFTEGSAMLNDAAYVSNTPISDEDSYTLIVTDLAGNVTTINFSIDLTPPVITIAPYTTTPTNQDITVNASVVGGTLNATSHTFTANGSFTFIATDLAGNQSQTTVTITNIDKVPPVVIGVVDGVHYNTNRSPSFNEGTALLNGSPYISETLIELEDDYVLVVTDSAGNVTTVNFTIDKTPPVVTGVVDGEYYNTAVSAVFTEGSAMLNDAVYVSNTPISDEDSYTLVVTDLAGNVTTINFTIDLTPPVITIAPYTTTPTNQDITVNASVVGGILNATSHTFTENGSFTFIATDLAGNQSQTTVTITNIDKTPPVVNGVTNNSYYNNDRIITFNEGSATLNSITFVTGDTVSDDGVYTLIVTDLAGNITTVNFVIDRTAPAVTGVENGMYYNTDRIINFEEGTATLNGDPFTSGGTVSDEGLYELIVTSLAGNITTISFTIDKTVPVVTGVANNMYYNTNRTITFNEGSATLNDVLFESGTTISADNSYTLVVTDLAGNITTVNFVIDKTAPVVTGVEDGEYYNTTVSAVFTEGSATLNGAVYLSNAPIVAEGSYTLIVTDLAGNITQVDFVIDKTPPVITIGTYTLTPTNQNITVNASTNEGSLNATSHTFTENGSFTFIATDLAGNVTQTVVTITNIDKVPPVVIGVVDGVHYNTNRNPTFNEGTALLNGSPYISGTLINAEDDYVLVVTDPAGNVTTVNFTIDKTPPVVIGVENGVYYNSNRLITFNEGSATLNGNAFTSGQTVSTDGNYTLIVTDLAGNITTISFVLDKILPIITIDPYNLDPTNENITVNASTNEGSLNATSHTFTENGSFTFIATDLAGNVSQRIITITNIDKDAPAVTGVSNNAFYNVDRTITFNKGTATLNGVTIVSGEVVSDEDDYILVVTDDAGNTTTVNFVIDKTAPIILGVLNNTYYNTNRTITFNEGSATLNSTSFNSGTIVSDEGSYTLIVLDLAGNVSTMNFVIDKTNPIVTGVAHNNYYNTNQTITFNEGSATLNGSAFTSGTLVSVENSYVLIVTDLAGNITTVNFVIDKTVPIVTGIANNNYYNTNRTITFNEGSATLNGSAFTSGTMVSTENTYVLIVTDLAGNITTVNFVLDKTPPVITIAPYQSVLPVSSVTVSATVNEGSLNASSRLFTANGSYTFIATDLAGNVTERIITISNIGYTLNYSLVGTGGDLIAMVNSIMVNSGSLVIESRSIMFTATPATRYRVYAWRLDGNVVGDRSNTYLLNMLNRGMNVTVEFVLEGDLNNSNSVSITDLVILRRHLAGLETINDKAKEAADINASGGISITDLVILRRRLAGLE